MRFSHAAYKLLSSGPAVYLTDIAIRRLYDGKIKRRGTLIDTNDVSISSWVRALIFWNMYETAELRLVRRHLPRDIDVIELGGSVGVVASYLAGYLGEGRRLISVEANPSLIEILTRNVEANGPRDRVTVVHGAIAYPVPPVDFVGMHFGASSLSGWLSNGSTESPEFHVRCLTLRELTLRHKVERFALISDIEGAEVGIFINEAETLRRCPLMIVELHEINYKSRHLSINDLVAIVIGLGYTLIDRHRDVYVFEKTWNQ